MKLLLAIIVFTYLNTLLADDLPEQDMANIESGEWHFSIALGAGFFENPVVNTPDLNIWLIPQATYYGESFYIDNLNMGYALYENDYIAVDIEGRLNEDGIFYSSSSNSLSALAFGSGGSRPGSRPFIPDEQLDRKLSYLSGLSITVPYGFGELYTGYFSDISKVHHGEEFHLSLSAYEQWKGWHWRVEVGMIYKSQQLLEYYYSTDVEFRGNLVRVYTPESGKNYYYILQLEKAINENWSFMFKTTYTELDKEIYNSHMIDQKKTMATFAGFEYHF